MRLRILFIAFVLVGGLIKTAAQNFDLGKVSIEELNEKQHPKDTSAVAAVLFTECESGILKGSGPYFYSNINTKVRIKIYKKEGLKWGESRYFLNKGLNERINVYNAFTYNLVDGKIEKTELDTNVGFLGDKFDNNFGQQVLVMPNVKVGSVIEFTIVRTQDAIVVPPRWDFQSSIPVNFSKFVTRIPELFVFKTFQRGMISPTISVSRKNTPSNFIEIVTTYTAYNLPALKEEEYVNNIKNYISSITHEFAMIDNNSGFSYSYANDWESVVKTIYDSDTFRYELDKTAYFRKELDLVLGKAKTQEEKIKVVFDFAKQSIKWNQGRGVHCGEGVRKAFISKSGNIAEINLMLTAMLRYSGLKASPVLISTRENGIAFYPSTSAFDYVIAAVEDKDGMIFLDASEKYATPNVLPIRDLNWVGRLIRDDRSSVQVSLMPEFLSFKDVIMVADIDSKGKVSGKVKNQFSDHLALDFRTTNHLTTNENYLENFENKHKIAIREYVRDNMEDLSKPVVETFLFESEKYSEIVEDKIYITPLLFLSKERNPFTQEKRDFPVDFGYPKQENYRLILNIPEGYTVESMPQQLDLVSQDGLESFHFYFQQNGNSIQLLATNTIKTAIVSSEKYPQLKDYFQQMINKQTEKIILKKI
ncbi:transglutaminase [Flavobacterium adhaerens]|uniref:transglutaminase n=1 Tax=Flavobacterium adhaerens TaxID=3149043 RepID=UPI0032B446EF